MDITIHVTSQLTNSERRISPQWSLKHLKHRFETITGIPPSDQQLLLFLTNISTSSITITSDDEETTTVGQLNITQGARIHVNDTRPVSSLTDLENEENGEFFELKDEEYDRLTGTVRHWKKENRLGRFDPTYEQRKEDQLKLNAEKSNELTVGSRFRTIDDGNGERRGVIRYVGKIPAIDSQSIWVGVEFDEPVGKNDGEVKGERYFTTQKNRGGFLKPVQIEQGDFPEEGLFSDDEEL